MKKLVAVGLLLLTLTGCSGKNEEMDRAMALRQELLAGSRVTFLAEVTADYGNAVHSFTLSCQGDSRGDLEFTVTKPETLAGIRGTISDTGGRLTFEDTALHFGLLTDRQLSPVSGPWIFLRTLRSGYLLSAAAEEDLLHVTAKDSYEDNALLTDIWLGPGDLPIHSEILYENRRILTLDLQDFQIVSGEKSEPAV